jgi:hypothetical protein
MRAVADTRSEIGGEHHRQGSKLDAEQGHGPAAARHAVRDASGEGQASHMPPRCSVAPARALQPQRSARVQVFTAETIDAKAEERAAPRYHSRQGARLSPEIAVPRRFPLSSSPHSLSFQVLGIAARVFGVDIQALTKKMDEVSTFMGKPMLEFNDCVTGVIGATAAKSASAAINEVLGEDARGTAVAEIEEFRDSPDSEALSQFVLPKALEGDALDQLLSAVEELDKAMRSKRQYINGLHCYTVRRPTAALPDKVMWLCAHHKSLLEQWDDGAITEEQLLARVEDPKAAAAESSAASAAASSSSSPASPPASAPLAPQPSVSPPAPVPGFFPTSFPPELKTLSAPTVASRIKAIAPVYGQYFQMFVSQGFDGETISTFAGMSFKEVSQNLEAAPYRMEQKVHRDRVVIEFNKLFDAKVYPIQEVTGAQSSPAPVRTAPTRAVAHRPHTRSCAISRAPSSTGAVPPSLGLRWPCHNPSRPCSPIAGSQSHQCSCTRHEKTWYFN